MPNSNAVIWAAEIEALEAQQRATSWDARARTRHASSPPPLTSARKKRKHPYRHLPPRSNPTPLSLHSAHRLLKLLAVGAYKGAFPTTISEYHRVQWFRDWGSRGRPPVRRYHEWDTFGAWKLPWREQPLFVDGVPAMVEAWGWAGNVPILLGELESLVEGIVELQRQKYWIELGKEEEEDRGYCSGSESEGGGEGGMFGWATEEVYDFAPPTGAYTCCDQVYEVSGEDDDDEEYDISTEADWEDVDGEDKNDGSEGGDGRREEKEHGGAYSTDGSGNYVYYPRGFLR